MFENIDGDAGIPLRARIKHHAIQLVSFGLRIKYSSVCNTNSMTPGLSRDVCKLDAVD